MFVALGTLLSSFLETFNTKAKTLIAICTTIQNIGFDNICKN